jgi:hypothetical protein
MDDWQNVLYANLKNGASPRIELTRRSDGSWSAALVPAGTYTLEVAAQPFSHTPELPGGRNRREPLVYSGVVQVSGGETKTVDYRKLANRRARAEDANDQSMGNGRSLGGDQVGSGSSPGPAETHGTATPSGSDSTSQTENYGRNAEIRPVESEANSADALRLRLASLSASPNLILLLSFFK